MHEIYRNSENIYRLSINDFIFTSICIITVVLGLSVCFFIFNYIQYTRIQAGYIEKENAIWHKIKLEASQTFILYNFIVLKP